ncbi:MAG: mechanosensitive ion channel family protein [Bacillota bacterium]|nr:mechanosensitive ion channel family protein [Bacillota bacterium]
MVIFQELFLQLTLNWQEIVFKWGGVFLRLILILVLAKFVLRFGYSIVDRVFVDKHKSISFGNRVETFSGLLKSILRYLIFFVAVLMILREFIDITPILAGAGIVGLAIGFGAQNLVRDIITGFFLVIEDQISVGDFVTIESYSGIVEQVGLRVTKIRDFGGQVHIFPNSKIEIVTNHSRGPQRALVDVSVAYEEDIDHVLKVLEEICAEFSKEHPEVKEGPLVLGVADLGDSEVVVRIIAQVEPMRQWQIERELRRTIKRQFDKLGIEIPYPRRVLFTGKDKSKKDTYLDEGEK